MTDVRPRLRWQHAQVARDTSYNNPFAHAVLDNEEGYAEADEEDSF